MVAIVLLPQEILETIAFLALQPADTDPHTQSLESVTKEDAVAIRMVCTTFAALLQPLDVLFGRFNLHATTRSLGNLQSICQSPRLRDRVTSVYVWQPMGCPFLHSIEAFEKAKRDLDTTSIRMPPLPQSYIKGYQASTRRDYSTKALAHLELLPRLHELQTDLKWARDGSGFWDCVMPGCFQRHPLQLRPPDQDMLFELGEHVTDIVRLASALAPRITSLVFSVLTRHLHPIHAQIFEEPAMQSFWQNLVELYLRITPSNVKDEPRDPIIWDDFYSSHVGSDTHSSKDFSAALEPIISATPMVEVLSIVPLDIWGFDHSKAWTTRNIDWQALHWPKLRQLSLDDAMLKPDDLCAFLERHSSTLRILHLDRQCVGPTPALSWYQIFQVIANSCTLNDVRVSNRWCDFDECRHLCVTESRQELEERSKFSAAAAAVLRDEHECAMNFELRDYLLRRRKKGSQALRDWWWSLGYVEGPDRRRRAQSYFGNQSLVDPATTFM